MARSKSGPKAKIELNEDQVAFMVSIGCTQEEMGAFFKCSVDTLKRNYAECLTIGAEQGKASAKRIMWSHFKLGNSTAIKYVVHNILKQKIEELGDKTKDLASSELMEKLASVSTDMILKLVKDNEDKVG